MDVLGGVKRILVIRAGALGDTLLMLPALVALRARIPQGQIDVMGYPERWAWVRGRHLIDAVHTIEQPGMHLLFCEAAQPPESLKKFLGDYDVILSYRPDRERLFETNLRRLGARLVLSQSPFPPPPPPTIHVADFALQLLAKLGVPPPLAIPRLQLTPSELMQIHPFWMEHGVDPRRDRIVVLHPGSGGSAKRWPLACFAMLAEALGAQPQVRIVIVAGYAEETTATRLLHRLQAVKPLVAANWPLLPTAALIAHAAAFIGNDSGLTHLAAFLGRPTVAIFGPTDPYIWGPRGEHVTIVRVTDGVICGEPDTLDGAMHGRPDILQVVEAAQRCLVQEEPIQSPDGRSARW